MNLIMFVLYRKVLTSLFFIHNAAKSKKIKSEKKVQAISPSSSFKLDASAIFMSKTLNRSLMMLLLHDGQQTTGLTQTEQ